jgi:hypothetical protein
MKMLTAKFIEGRLDLPEGCLHEGDTVTLLVPEAEEGFRLSLDERVLLLEAMGQADRGEVIDGWRLLDELKD